MRRLAAIAFCGVMAAACGESPPVEGPAQMHGVKMYLNQEGLQARYPDYDTLAGELQDAGVDALFTTPYEGKTAFYASEILPERDAAIDMVKLRESARTHDVRFGAICHVFFDADTLAERPDLVPIDQHGDGTFVNWQHLVCPSDPDYRAYKLSIVKEVAATIRPDVISLDFMRFPTTWEIIPPDTAPDEIRNFCFCDRCLTGFQDASAVSIPEELDTTPAKAEWILTTHEPEWVTWKTDLITSFVEEASREVRAIDPDIEVSVHVVPWAEDVFDNALVWNAGQDIAAMASHVDYLSPMVYHKLIGLPNEYIRTLTAEFYEKTQKKILPSIQAAQIISEGEVSAEEFRQSLDYALEPPSSGTLIFHWGELRLDDQSSALKREKREIFRTTPPR